MAYRSLRQVTIINVSFIFKPPPVLVGHFTYLILCPTVLSRSFNLFEMFHGLTRLHILIKELESDPKKYSRR